MYFLLILPQQFTFCCTHRRTAVTPPLTVHEVSLTYPEDPPVSSFSSPPWMCTLLSIPRSSKLSLSFLFPDLNAIRILLFARRSCFSPNTQRPLNPSKLNFHLITICFKISFSALQETWRSELHCNGEMFNAVTRYNHCLVWRSYTQLVWRSYTQSVWRSYTQLVWRSYTQLVWRSYTQLVWRSYTQYDSHTHSQYDGHTHNQYDGHTHSMTVIHTNVVGPLLRQLCGRCPVRILARTPPSLTVFVIFLILSSSALIKVCTIDHVARILSLCATCFQTLPASLMKCM